MIINNMYQKKILFSFFCLYASLAQAQLSGGFESNSALYVDDSKIKLDQIEAADRVRSNSYLRIDYKLKNFSAGFQAESYSPKALLNYSPVLKGTGIGTYYINYYNPKLRIDITAGHFYEQFGSGLALRTWEDRQLGIANSISGGRIKYSPLQSVHLTALYGKQRNGLGFNFTNGFIGGFDAVVELSSLCKAKKITYSAGFSFVNRNENTEINQLSNNNYITSVRGDFSVGGFTADAEYAFKSKDALVEFGAIRPGLQFDGDAYLLNLGYTKNGFGITANLRRLENFGFYSERSAAGNVYSQGVLNYIPALTKQQDYSLTNIYVYAAQPGISFEPGRNKAGETGGQLEAFFQIKKGTILGGKNGTGVTINFSQWHGLSGKYDAAQRKYKADLLGAGEKYYRDASIEVRKKWSDNWMSVFTYQNQYYNARYVEESVGEVYTNTLVADNTFKINKKKSVRWQLQHQWAAGGFGNWAAAQAEYNFNSEWTVFVLDLYNYGNKDDADKVHYYNTGASFNKNAWRVQAGYGRQRGGLICVGGICRFVPESAGFNLAVAVSF